MFRLKGGLKQKLIDDGRGITSRFTPNPDKTPMEHISKSVITLKLRGHIFDQNLFQKIPQRGGTQKGVSISVVHLCEHARGH